MKKITLFFAAALIVLSTLAVPTTVHADGNPNPFCPDGSLCKPPR